jgi:hypothetical protein
VAVTLLPSMLYPFSHKTPEEVSQAKSAQTQTEKEKETKRTSPSKKLLKYKTPDCRCLVVVMSYI